MIIRLYDQAAIFRKVISGHAQNRFVREIQFKGKTDKNLISSPLRIRVPLVGHQHDAGNNCPEHVRNRPKHRKPIILPVSETDFSACGQPAHGVGIL